MGAGEKHGGMELDEFDIGQCRPGPQCCGHSITGRDRWIGGRREHLADSSACQHHRTGMHDSNVAGPSDRRIVGQGHLHADATRSVFGLEEVKHKRV